MSERRRPFGVGAFLTYCALTTLFAAVGCSEDTSETRATGGLPGTGGTVAGRGGETSQGGSDTGGAGSAGETSKGGSDGGAAAGSGGATDAGNAGAGAESSGGAAAGSGGAGGAGNADCEGPYQLLTTVSDAMGNIVSWPELHRVGVGTPDGVQIYEVANSGVTLAETLDPAQLGLADDESISEFVAYGAGLVILTRTPGTHRLIVWDPESGAEDMLTAPAYSGRLIASAASKSVAVASGTSAFVATELDGEWSWAQPIEHDRYLVPLALPEGGVLIGVREGDDAADPPEGAGGAGGAGGAAGAGGGEDTSARVERWNLAGERTERYEAVGEPSMALELADGSYLIAETNSFWGSYEAALERYETSGALDTLVRVPVRSSSDGEDGAFDLAIAEDQLFIANCESGLLRTEWPGDGADPGSLALTRIEGPWATETGVCTSQQVEALDDILVVGAGDRQVFFVRLCAAP